jgi:hypothetical protein
MAEWVPDMASLELEQLMEEKELPESDRDELRKFSEFLRRRKDKKDGKEVPPLTQQMKDYLLGKEITDEPI